MTAAEDEILEAEILSRLLATPGAARTMPELIRELEAGRDDVNRALCSLADYGLLEFKGDKLESLRPTLAARSCRRLLAVAPR
jgi:DNA-binding GntR family transcriptional regulator